MSNLSERVYIMEMKENKKIQEEKQRLEEINQIQKRKEQEKERKQYEKDLFIAVEQDLINTFSSTFEREGLERGTINLQLLSSRKEILQNVPESTSERNYIERNYEKILAKVRKIYENDQKSREYVETMKIQPIIEEERKKQERKNIINNSFLILGQILKWTFLCTIGAIFLLFKFLLDLADR